MTKKITQSEGDYLKAIFQLAKGAEDKVNTNALSQHLKTSAASVSDMVKKLGAKKLIAYEPYRGVRLTKSGLKVAVRLLRSHRLWEVFLVEKLKFKWDEVHDIAEVMEHLDNEKLTERLNQFLDYPKFDPHGDPIPDKDGNIVHHSEITIAHLQKSEKGIVVAVLEHSAPFLQHLDVLNIKLGSKIQLMEIVDYDGSVKIKVDSKGPVSLSQKVARNILVHR